jgi:hypothetical protein
LRCESWRQPGQRNVNKGCHDHSAGPRPPNLLRSRKTFIVSLLKPTSGASRLINCTVHYPIKQHFWVSLLIDILRILPPNALLPRTPASLHDSFNLLLRALEPLSGMAKTVQGTGRKTLVRSNRPSNPPTPARRGGASSGKEVIAKSGAAQGIPFLPWFSNSRCLFLLCPSPRPHQFNICLRIGCQYHALLSAFHLRAHPSLALPHLYQFITTKTRQDGQLANEYRHYFCDG